MPSQATVTAKTGPNVTNTAIVLSGVTEIHTYPDKRVIQFVGSSPTAGPYIKEYDLGAVTTYTVVIAAGNYTVTIS
jgi:hypothetical protein